MCHFSQNFFRQFIRWPAAVLETIAASTEYRETRLVFGKLADPDAFLENSLMLGGV